MNGSLLVAGTHSDAGKTVVVAGLCRWLAPAGRARSPRSRRRTWRSTRPSPPTAAEIGRAQAVQAAAAGIEPEAAMNPVLLKPGSDTPLPGDRARPAVRATSTRAATSRSRRSCARSCSTPGRPARPLRRGDLRGRRQPGRDQPAPRRPRQHGPGPGRRAAGAAGRRHRPRRRVRLPLRHPCPARRRTTSGWWPASWSTSSAATGGCSRPAWSSCGARPAGPTLGVLPWRRGLWLDAEDSPRPRGPPRRTAADPLGDVLEVASSGCRG